MEMDKRYESWTGDRAEIIEKANATFESKSSCSAS